MRALVIWFATALAATAQTVPVPSGQFVHVFDVIRDIPGADGDVWRFRFLAPSIAREGGTVDLDTAFADIEAICTTHVIPLLAAEPDAPSRVIVSLSDRPVTFGQPNPEATQIFEAFRVENDACIWEGF